MLGIYIKCVWVREGRGRKEESEWEREGEREGWREREKKIGIH
jgi:hypothetical protein